MKGNKGEQQKLKVMGAKYKLIHDMCIAIEVLLIVDILFTAFAGLQAVSKFLKGKDLFAKLASNPQTIMLLTMVTSPAFIGMFICGFCINRTSALMKDNTNDIIEGARPDFNGASIKHNHDSSCVTFSAHPDSDSGKKVIINAAKELGDDTRVTKAKDLKPSVTICETTLKQAIRCCDAIRITTPST